MAKANSLYYANRDPFADFTTSPEISQVFGELLGAWVVVAWHQMGAPTAMALVEAGPGRGTLMQDALRAIGRVAPACRGAIEVHFIEMSAQLRREQAARVPVACWHEGLSGLPTMPAIFLANEFLDALPIRQFVRRERGWVERFVAGGQFVEVAADGPARVVAVGSIVEVSEASAGWIAEVARRISAYGGAALILDYGSAQSLAGDSLQALKGGGPVDPLLEPGTADVTAHVDFGAISAVARREGAAVWGPVPQGIFLGRLGLWQRISALQAAHPDCGAALNEAASRLASPARMGALFKVLCLADPEHPTPPGFE